MLFYKDLENIVFTRNQIVPCDELVVISGYVGPTPVSKLGTLPIKSTVIYGMYGSDGIRVKLHDALLEQSKILTQTQILYSTTPVHSKCYVWRNKSKVVASLIGSANFSTNGLTTPFKEVLAESSVDTFEALNDYIELVIKQSIPCEKAKISESKQRIITEAIEPTYQEGVAPMPLYILEAGQKVIPERSGLNWGMAKLTGSHVCINDAYIPIRADLVKHYPEIFPSKQDEPIDTSTGKKQRHNDAIEILWDDGTTMVGLLEGNLRQVKNGVAVKYPKQIASHPTKKLMGVYLRERLGVPEGQAIKYSDLARYGRDTIDISLQGEGIYFFDFSV
jgi:hypothetical protein